MHFVIKVDGTERIRISDTATSLHTRRKKFVVRVTAVPPCEELGALSVTSTKFIDHDVATACP